MNHHGPTLPAQIAALLFVTIVLAAGVYLVWVWSPYPACTTIVTPR